MGAQEFGQAQVWVRGDQEVNRVRAHGIGLAVRYPRIVEEQWKLRWKHATKKYKSEVAFKPWFYSFEFGLEICRIEGTAKPLPQTSAFVPYSFRARCKVRNWLEKLRLFD
jgi:hypothetical protein